MRYRRGDVMSWRWGGVVCVSGCSLCDLQVVFRFSTGVSRCWSVVFVLLLWSKLAGFWQTRSEIVFFSVSVKPIVLKSDENFDQCQWEYTYFKFIKIYKRRSSPKWQHSVLGETNQTTYTRLDLPTSSSLVRDLRKAKPTNATTFLKGARRLGVATAAEPKLKLDQNGRKISPHHATHSKLSIAAILLRFNLWPGSCFVLWKYPQPHVPAAEPETGALFPPKSRFEENYRFSTPFRLFTGPSLAATVFSAMGAVHSFRQSGRGNYRLRVNGASIAGKGFTIGRTTLQWWWWL